MKTEILLYLLKVNLIVTAVWLFCRLLLSRDIRFGRKRLIINIGVITAFILPLLPALPVTPTYGTVAAHLPAIPVPAVTIPAAEIQTGAVTGAVTDYLFILLCVYAGVTTLMFMRTLIRISSVIRLTCNCRHSVCNGVSVWRIPGSEVGPFSFFGRIYAGETVGLTDYMLCHEEAHLRQYHSVDILLSELLVDMLWINPAAWLLRREIADNLEFLADESVVTPENRRNYQLSLISTCSGHSTPAVCTNFNVSSIKRRITMINRISTTSRGRWIYAIALPALLLVSLIGCARSDAKAESTTESTQQTSEPEPAAHPETAGTTVQETTFPEEWQTYLFKNLEFPESAIKDSIDGIVKIKVTVDASGKVINSVVTESVRKDVDDAALRVIQKAPKLRRSRDGKPREFIIPIRFCSHPRTHAAPKGR